MGGARPSGTQRAQEAAVQLAQATYDRAAQIVNSGAVTRAAFDQARFGLQQAQQQLESLRVQAQVQLAKLGGELAAVGGKLATTAAELEQEAANLAEERAKRWGFEVQVAVGVKGGPGAGGNNNTSMVEVKK